MRASPIGAAGRQRGQGAGHQEDRQQADQHGRVLPTTAAALSLCRRLKRPAPGVLGAMRLETPAPLFGGLNGIFLRGVVGVVLCVLFIQRERE